MTAVWFYNLGATVEKAWSSYDCCLVLGMYAVLLSGM